MTDLTLSCLKRTSAKNGFSSIGFILTLVAYHFMATDSCAEWSHFNPIEKLRGTVERSEAEEKKPELLPAPPWESADFSKSEFDLNNARVMAYLSAIAYFKLPDEQGTPDMDAINAALSGWKGVVTVPLLAPPVQGFILKTADTAVVVIRGSDETPDWTSNMKAVFPGRKVLGPKVMGRMAVLNPPEKEPVAPKHHTHLGFQRNADLIYPQVRETLRGYEGKTVRFTGHSLGGAISTILNRDLHQKDGFRNTGVYTFGAPMPGSVANSNYFVTEDIPAHRVEFDWDPVPSKPGNFRFHPVGRLTYLHEDSENRCSLPDENFFQRKTREIIASTVIRPSDHSMVRYYNCLSRVPG